MERKNKGISLLAIPLLAVMTLFSLAACDEGGGEDGTITVVLVNAGAEDGEVVLFAVFTPGGEPGVVEPLAFGGDVVSGGTAQDTVIDDNGAIRVFSAGTYDVFAIVDHDQDDQPTNGEPYGKTTGVEVDGDITVELDYNTFTAWSW